MAKVSHSIGCHRHGLVKYGQLLRNINFYFAMCCSYRGDETLLNKIFYLDFKYKSTTVSVDEILYTQFAKPFTLAVITNNYTK